MHPTLWQFVVQVSMMDRLHWLGLEKWRTNVRIHVDLFFVATDRDERYAATETAAAFIRNVYLDGKDGSFGTSPLESQT
jgi:hypothetical protein